MPDLMHYLNFMPTSDINEDPEPVLTSTLFVNPIQWIIDEQIFEASNSERTPPGCPPDHTYVPRTVYDLQTSTPSTIW